MINNLQNFKKNQGSERNHSQIGLPLLASKQDIMHAKFTGFDHHVGVDLGSIIGGTHSAGQ